MPKGVARKTQIRSVYILSKLEKLKCITMGEACELLRIGHAAALHLFRRLHRDGAVDLWYVGNGVRVMVWCLKDSQYTEFDVYKAALRRFKIDVEYVEDLLKTFVAGARGRVVKIGPAVFIGLSSTARAVMIDYIKWRLGGAVVRVEHRKKEGKAVKWSLYIDRDKAAEALGL
jgi:hypothetical protein